MALPPFHCVLKTLNFLYFEQGLEYKRLEFTELVSRRFASEVRDKVTEGSWSCLCNPIENVLAVNALRRQSSKPRRKPCPELCCNMRESTLRHFSLILSGYLDLFSPIGGFLERVLPRIL